MNNVVLMGRLTRDPDIRYSAGDKPMCIASFNLAVDRRFKRNGDASADFINCKAFGKTGEFIEKYVSKGTKLVVRGRIQAGSYTNKDGNKVYTTDVVVEETEFAGSKKAAQDSGNYTEPKNTDSDGFMNIPEGLDEELPFV